MKFKVNDTVRVIAGKDKGKDGVITKIMPKKQQAIVKGVNTYKRHLRKQGDNPGGIVEIERPLDASKVQLVSPHTNQITRIGYQITKTGDKIRICKKSGKPIDTK